MERTRDGAPVLQLVSDCGVGVVQEDATAARPAGLREVDWSILMARAQSGDRDAYRRLLEGITPYLRSLAVRAHRDPLDVEDTVQDILLSVHCIRHTYDPGRPFGPWLVAIAHRRIVDRLRRQGRTRRHETPLESEHEALAAVGGGSPEAHFDAVILHRAVGCLPHKQREAITLMKLQEMSLTKAADASGNSAVALRVAAHRGLKALRRFFAGPGGQP